MDLIHTAVLLPPEVRELIEDLARREDRSISSLMRQLVLRGLSQMGEWPPRNKKHFGGNDDVQKN